MLPIDFRCELRVAGLVARPTPGHRSDLPGKLVDAVVRSPRKQRMVKGVESLQPELQLQPFRDPEVLGKVGVIKHVPCFPKPGIDNVGIRAIVGNPNAFSPNSLIEKKLPPKLGASLSTQPTSISLVAAWFASSNDDYQRAVSSVSRIDLNIALIGARCFSLYAAGVWCSSPLEFLDCTGKQHSELLERNALHSQEP